jgi:mono/diheme cytochrome c family protein
MEETMKRTMTTLLLVTACALAVVLATSSAKGTKPAPAALAKQSQVARGEYLVTIGGCNDCHTPFKMGPKGPEPDMSRMLSGHPQQVVMPPPPKLANGPWAWSGAITNTAFAGPWGISYARNLTPDQVSGTGIWTEEMFIKTIRTGRHWGVSRPILPPMPWFNYAKMSDDDLKAVWAYLRSIKPVRNEVPEAVVAPPPSAMPAS